MKCKLNLSHIFMEIGLHACVYSLGLVTQVKLHYVAALEGEQGVKKQNAFPSLPYVHGSLFLTAFLLFL